MTLRESIEALLTEYRNFFAKSEKQYPMNYQGGYNLGCDTVLHRVIAEIEDALKEGEQEGGS